MPFLWKKNSKRNLFRKEILDFEGYMDQLHGETQSLSPFWQSRAEKIGQGWLNLLLRGRSSLMLKEKEEKRLEELFYLLLQGELNNSGRERELEELIAFRLAYEEKTKKPFKNFRKKLTYLLFFVVLLLYAYYLFLLKSLNF